MTEVPAHLRAIVDRAAGREHSAVGSVMRCLAEVLAVHEKEVLRAAAARQRRLPITDGFLRGQRDALADLIDPDVTPFEQSAADIASRFAHGHAELVDGCALCIAEYDAVVALSHEDCGCPNCATKETPT